ncbi:bifunctional enoyl-CoA hydratase/phosphate acetyltransferase [Candidatus Chlorohelix sp.]|uniref:bifunctional enoyl-CoA hydratase/phosphate acetyltransferase n=1 Tax=Candidatus Chlorohelix sp. TaxID=3139201 RepID=UPI003067A58A
MEYIENRIFDEIELGETASLMRTLSQEDIELFAVMSGDVNPAHLDLEYARSDMFHKIIAHGMWGGSLISTLLGTKLPGPGTIYLAQTLKFKRPVALGDTITVTIKAVAKDEQRNGITFDCTCVNQKGEVVISGSAEVIAPTERVKRPRITLPEVFLYEHGARYHTLIEAADKLDPVTVAVINPFEPDFLASIVEATQKNIIKPIIIGPTTKIRAAAEAAGIDITPFKIHEAEYGGMSAREAVKLARLGEVDALVKGNLPYEDLMQAVNAPNTGLTTNQRMSHAFIMDVPMYSKLLFLTDAVLNIYPDLDAKRDIVQNAIDLAHVVGLENPKVAILSAVLTVNEHIKSTLDAAALCKMVDRGQISGGIVDGPLSFDTAISAQATKERGIISPVAGIADILVVPDLESGNILARQLEYLAEAQGIGVVLGARVPIMLAIHADSHITHLASYALASLLAHSRHAITP